jgi:hypothetical protein
MSITSKLRTPTFGLPVNPEEFEKNETNYWSLPENIKESTGLLFYYEA